jgi:hypothetical protein
MKNGEREARAVKGERRKGILRARWKGSAYKGFCMQRSARCVRGNGVWCRWFIGQPHGVTCGNPVPNFFPIWSVFSRLERGLAKDLLQTQQPAA